LWAGFKYMLIKRGLLNDEIDVLFKCGFKTGLSWETFSQIVNLYRDGLISGFECKNDSIIASVLDVIKLVIDKKGNALLTMPDGIRLGHIDLFIISETWLHDIHFLNLDLNNWLVFDIGAYVGDASLYYAKRGATVIAVEPVPHHFQIMLKNIELNPELKSKIVPVNAAISSNEGYTNIFYDNTVDGAASIYETKRFKDSVRSMRLSTLMNEISNFGINYESFKIKALKMDCKGCEWDVVNNELEALKLFDIIKIEYSGYLRNYTYEDLLAKIMPLGYKCRIWAHNEIAVKIGLSKHGTMTCIREGFNPLTLMV
ncbi:MAG TPA: FkbM family methyltransferase, partial [Fervidicoccus fontis]|nr:FkbM family methyltransferase [Fervidicoccus fontis]